MPVTWKAADSSQIGANTLKEASRRLRNIGRVPDWLAVTANFAGEVPRKSVSGGVLGRQNEIDASRFMESAWMR